MILFIITKMYSPLTLSRILVLKTKVRFYTGNGSEYLNKFKKIFAPNKPNPLGRWCHPESDIYKDKCKPLKKIDLANLDNDAAYHNDEFDVIAHLEMYKEFEKRD